MRIVLLTSATRGMVSRCVPLLNASPKIALVGVILSGGRAQSTRRRLLQKLRKIRKIGFLGALNGIRMRRWFADDATEDIREISERFGVPLFQVDNVNGGETKRILRELRPDLGLSLGNGYISESVFSLPKQGMINFHSELLPQFRGAQSVIWAIYSLASETGFSIHRIDKGIDTGTILYQERFQIDVRRTLKETVEANLLTVIERAPRAILFVCENFLDLLGEASKQGEGKTYTTPSFGSFLKMIRNNSRMYRERHGDRPLSNFV